MSISKWRSPASTTSLRQRKGAAPERRPSRPSQPASVKDFQGSPLLPNCFHYFSIILHPQAASFEGILIKRKPRSRPLTVLYHLLVRRSLRLHPEGILGPEMHGSQLEMGPDVHFFVGSWPILCIKGDERASGSTSGAVPELGDASHMAVFPGCAFPEDMDVGVDGSALRQDAGASEGHEGSRGTSLLSSRSSCTRCGAKVVASSWGPGSVESPSCLDGLGAAVP